MSDTLKPNDEVSRELIKELTDLRKERKKDSAALAATVYAPAPSELTSDRTFEVHCGEKYGQPQVFRLTVPKGTKVTYGPVSPQHGGANYVRFYEGTSQIAVFDNVLRFFDTGLNLLHQKVVEEATDEAETSTTGGKKRKVIAKRTVSWE